MGREGAAGGAGRPAARTARTARTAPTTPTTPTTPTVLAVLVAALVAGILGMHALTSHGPEHAAGHDSVGSARVVDTAHSAHGLPPEHAASAAGALDSEASVGPVREQGSGGMLGHCLAFLVAAAGALLAVSALVRRRVRWVWRACERAAVGVGLAPDRRATGPPPVWEFSVVRC